MSHLSISLSSLGRRLSRGSLLLLLPLLACADEAKPYPTSGGEGGKVVTVTSLNDSGPGSLREAVTTPGPCVIKFSVAGEIWLNDMLKIHNSFLTIDGSSAPSPGISILGDRVFVRGHDIILRDLRVRPGARLQGSDPGNRDGISITGKEDGTDPDYNILVENCSVSWAIDEDMEIWGKNNHDIVVRNCILAECLEKSIHPKGNHSMGLLTGPETNHLIIEDNLFAHNAHRNPVIHGSTSAVVVNNLIYDPLYNGFHTYAHPKTPAPTLVDVVGNVVIAGPSTRPVLPIIHENGDLNRGTRIYLKDNLAVGTKTFNDKEMPTTWPAGSPSPFVDAPPVPLEHVTLLPTDQVEASVLAKAGARPGDRDEVDKRIIEEVKTRTGTVRNWPTDPRLMPTPDQLKAMGVKPPAA